MKWLNRFLLVALLMSLAILPARAVTDTSKPAMEKPPPAVPLSLAQSEAEATQTPTPNQLESWETTEPGLAAVPEEHPDPVEPTGSACAAECSGMIDFQDDLINHLIKRIEVLEAK